MSDATLYAKRWYVMRFMQQDTVAMQAWRKTAEHDLIEEAAKTYFGCEIQPPVWDEPRACAGDPWNPRPWTPADPPPEFDMLVARCDILRG